MSSLFLHQLLFLAALAMVLFVPGMAVLSFLERRARIFTGLEKLFLSAAISLVVVDAVLLVLDALKIPLNALSVLLSLISLSLIFFFLTKRKASHSSPNTEEKTALSKQKVSLAFLVLLISLVTLKTFYFLPNVVPSATDLGHHMYWVKKIALDQKLPAYTKQDIVEMEGKYTLSEPEPISDFIVGEHLALSALQMLSQMEFTSSFSALTLFLIHILTMVALYALALRLFENLPYKQNIALLVFFLIGILFTFAPPQMKYILGGVVGNTLGNLLIVSLLLLLLVAIRKNQSSLLALIIFLTFGLAYTHHLSMLLFGIILFFSCFFFLILRFQVFRVQVLPLLKQPAVWSTLVLCLTFFFFIATPSYIQNSAVSTVIGTAVNAEHMGLSFAQLKFTVGEPRMIFGLFGLILLFSLKNLRRSDTAALLLGWTFPLTFLVLKADLVYIDLPSARVANYLIFPLTLLAGFTLVWIFETMLRQSLLPAVIRYGVFGILLLFTIHNGLFDNTRYLSTQSESAPKMLSLFQASQFLATTLPPEATVVHDHVNILGDAWIKLAFMRDYNYPFYRAHFFRYERARDKQEACTLVIVSTPNTENALRCIRDLEVEAILVNETSDGQQFKHFQNFWQIYNDAYYSVYRYAPAE